MRYYISGRYNNQNVVSIRYGAIQKERHLRNSDFWSHLPNVSLCYFFSNILSLKPFTKK